MDKDREAACGHFLLAALFHWLSYELILFSFCVLTHFQPVKVIPNHYCLLTALADVQEVGTDNHVLLFFPFH